MAKTNGPGFFERHVEKGVLTAALLILVITLSVWVVSSRRKVPLSVGAFSPGEVDQRLLEQAERSETFLEEITPQTLRVEDFLARMREGIQRPSGIDRDYVQWGPARQPLEAYTPVGADRPKVELSSLALLAPERPIAGVYREVTVVPAAPDAGQPASQQYKEVIAAHVVAVFPHGELRKKWEATLAETYVRADLTVITVEAERRRRLPDGTWSQPVPVSFAKLPTQQPLPLLPAYDETNLLEVQQGIMQLASAQEEILEPGYPQIVSPSFQIDTWMLHKPRTRVSDLLEEGLSAGTVLGGRSALPTGRTMRGRSPGAGQFVPGGDRVRPDIRRLDDFDVRDEIMRGPPDATRPPTRGTRPPTRGTRPPTRSTRPPTRSTRPPSGTIRRPPSGSARYTRPDTGRDGRPDISRYTGPDGRPVRPGAGRYQEGSRPGTPPRPGVAPAMPEPPAIPLVPSLAQQLAHEKGILELWFHDTNLKEAMTYSYRVRLVVASPLFGRFGAVKDDADAKQLKLIMPWSQWSQPVTAKRPTEFFVVGAFKGREEVYMEVFTLKGVQRLKRRFTVRRGEPIGDLVKMDVLGLDGEQKNTEVNFDTGAVVVDVDFDKRLPLQKTGMSPTTTEVLFLDPDGRLQIKTMHEDKSSSRLQKLKIEVRQAPVVRPRWP